MTRPNEPALGRSVRHAARALLASLSAVAMVSVPMANVSSAVPATAKRGEAVTAATGGSMVAANGTAVPDPAGTVSALTACPGPAGVATATKTAPASTTPVATAHAAPNPVAAPLATTERLGRDHAVAQTGVQLPADEAPHHGPVEWWYFNGHLEATGPGGRLHCYGYEYVTFQFIGVAPGPVYVADFAITDLDREAFHYAAKERSSPLPVTKDSFSFRTGNWSMMGASGKDVLRADLPGYTIHLNLKTTEPAVLEGQDGVVSLGPLGSSKYYSWTSLLTSGTIIDHGTTMKVSGISWMDHQWGALEVTSGAGWDWFSLQLANGQQYMVYFVRNRAGAIVDRFATQAGSTGKVEHLKGDIGERVTGSWHSPASGITYSSGWELTLPEGRLAVTPDLKDQELDLRKVQGNAYWEGDVSVNGELDGTHVTGVGYTELNPPGGLL